MQHIKIIIEFNGGESNSPARVWENNPGGGCGGAPHKVILNNTHIAKIKPNEPIILDWTHGDDLVIDFLTHKIIFNANDYAQCPHTNAHAEVTKIYDELFIIRPKPPTQKSKTQEKPLITAESGGGCATLRKDGGSLSNRIPHKDGQQTNPEKTPNAEIPPHKDIAIQNTIYRVILTPEFIAYTNMSTNEKNAIKLKTPLDTPRILSNGENILIHDNKTEIIFEPQNNRVVSYAGK